MWCVSVYVCLHVCMLECVSLPTLLWHVTLTHLNHTQPHRDQRRILCTSKAMTDLADPPGIKKSHDNWNTVRLYWCCWWGHFLHAFSSSKMNYFAAFVGEHYPSQTLRSLLVCCFCLFLLSFRLKIKIMMAKNEELQMVPIPKEERSIMRRRKMRKKRGPLSLRNRIGEPKCSRTRLLDSAQPPIFFHAALKQVPPTEF